MRFLAATEDFLYNDKLFNTELTTPTPPNKIPITQEDLTWLSKQFFYDDQDDLAEIQKLAEKIPVLDKEGNEVPSKTKLVLFNEIHRFLKIKQDFPFDLLHSIVLYPDSIYLTKKNATGLTLSYGSNCILSLAINLETIYVQIEQICRALEPLGGSSQKLSNEILSVLRNWVLSVRPENQRQRVAPLEREAKEIEQKTEQIFSNLRILVNDLPQQDLKSKLDNIENQLKSGFENIRAFADQEWDNKCVLHFSWFWLVHNLVDPNSNIVIHELAHVVDFESQGLNGSPRLPNSKSKAEQADFEKLWQTEFDREKNRTKNTLNSYSITNRKEFFAVSTEAFFSQPNHLKQKNPDLYALLVKTYLEIPRPKPKASFWKRINFIYLSKLISMV